MGCVEDIQEALIEFGKKLQEMFQPVIKAMETLVDNEEFRNLLIEYQNTKKGGGEIG